MGARHFARVRDSSSAAAFPRKEADDCGELEVWVKCDRGVKMLSFP